MGIWSGHIFSTYDLSPPTMTLTLKRDVGNKPLFQGPLCEVGSKSSMRVNKCVKYFQNWTKG